MREDDARRLDHETLEALRERAVRCVQSGERPTIVARSLGITNRTMFGWLASSRPTSAATWAASTARSPTTCPVPTGITQRGNADQVVPAVDGNLTGDDERSPVIAILDDSVEPSR